MGTTKFSDIDAGVGLSDNNSNSWDSLYTFDNSGGLNNQEKHQNSGASGQQGGAHTDDWMAVNHATTSDSDLTKPAHINEFTYVANSNDAAGETGINTSFRDYKINKVEFTSDASTQRNAGSNAPNTDYSETQEYFNETEAADVISEGDPTPPAPTGLRNSDGAPMLLDASDYGY